MTMNNDEFDTRARCPTSHRPKIMWTRRELLKYLGLGAAGVLATEVTSQFLPGVVSGTTTLPVRTSQDFALRGTIVTINTLCHNARNYQPHGWNILEDLGVNVVAVGGGIEGDVAHFNMNSYPDEWAKNLDTFLAQAEAHGVKVAFKQLGNKYGTLFNIVAPEPGYEVAGTPIESAKKMVDRLAGSNSLALNFIADPRIFGWSVANEVDMGDPTTRDWCIQMLDYIRSKGGKAYVGSPCDSRFPRDSITRDLTVDFHFLEPTLRGHADYLECHIYELQTVVDAINKGLDVYEATYNIFRDRMRSLMIDGRGTFLMNELILGEFGMWHGKATGSYQVTYDFDEKTRGAYYRAVYQAASDLGISNIANECCFDQKYRDGSYAAPPYGIIDTDGTYFIECTSVLQYYYKIPGSVRSHFE